MGPALKRALERLLVAAGPARIARAGLRGRVMVLAYHNVVPDGVAAGGDRSLHLPRAEFARQLDVLADWFDVIPLATVPSALASGRPQAVITFDDAYRGAIRLGLEELRSRRLPATVFVAPGMLEDRTFWWDALASDRALDERTRRHCLDGLRGEDPTIRDWAVREGLTWREAPEHSRSASIEELLGVRGHATFGSHSWSHPNLARVEPAVLHRELTRSREWLAARCREAYVPWLAYPYGLRSAEASEAAGRAGYERALLVTGGPARLGPDLGFDLPRLNVPGGVSVEGFKLRVSGLFA